MKIRLVVLCLILSTFGLYSQRERNLDSIAKANVQFIQQLKDSVYYLSTNPYKRFRFTISARVNDNINFSRIENLTIHDYLSLGVYDIRLRYYLTHHLKVFQRMLITGIDEENYFFTTGLILRF